MTFSSQPGSAGSANGIGIPARQFRGTSSVTRWEPVMVRVPLLPVLFFWVAGSAHAVDSAPLPLEAFASLPHESQVVLSPSGAMVANVVNEDGYSDVVVRAAGASAPPRSVLGTDNREHHINWIEWANEDRLLVSIRQTTHRGDGHYIEHQLFSVAADGSGHFNLIKPPRHFRHVPQIQDVVVDWLAEDPEHVLIALDLNVQGEPEVFRVDVNDGERKLVQRRRTGAQRWMTDQQHRVRLAEGVSLGRHHIEVITEPESNTWTRLWEFDALTADEVQPLGFGKEPQTLYYRAVHGEHMAIFRRDLSRLASPGELVFADPERDVNGDLMYALSTGEVVGVRHRGDDGEQVLWDENARATLEQLSVRLPQTRNIIVDRSADEKRYVVLAISDREPGTYYLGDHQTDSLTPFAYRYPELPPQALAGKQPVSYQAGDGHTIRGFLSLPQGHQDGQQIAAVVLPHGGPTREVDGDFDYWSALFADRGYAVLQMNFRGSSGDGIEHLQAGLGNWATVIHDDITDGARWLVEQGIADPDRLCIVGGSFGGYAALLGVARAGDLYRCAVAVAPVTDLQRLAATSRLYTDAHLRRAQIGSGRQHLRESSPIQMVDAIDDPVLIVHGTDDGVVSVEHSRAMAKKLDKAGKDVIYVELEDGDHTLSSQPNRLEAMRQIDAFLATHLRADSITVASKQ
jgi:dipeptidyl aminopeptidase/acylaminoacyl peptidase